MQTEDHARTWRVHAILGMGLLAISVSAILIRYASEAPGEAVAVWRTITAAVLLSGPAMVKSRAEWRTFSGREWMLVVLAGFFLGLHFVMWISSLYFTSVASASTLVSLSPIFMGIIGFVVLRERLTRLETIGIMVALAGTVLLQFAHHGHAGDVGSNPLLGNSLALAAAGFVSIYLLIGRVVRQNRSWLAYVAPLYAMTALTTVAVAVVRDVPLLGYSATFYGLCILMAIVPQLLGHGALNYAIRYFPAATLGLASLFEPVGASVLAFAFFGEIPTLLAVLAMGVILGAVSIVLTRR